ncbi:putative bem1 bud5 suppressor [Vairimorpha apis BRL 01]|uniref:Putative bem1 bud5 suppressor n=1 Tax=Vairimorpha apis BRL 01 TaxID=1037528 RepID=T0MFG6_9MICR|nr:putative bem1 bud5 suppressor [Vairimorpha apis BRL 01]
MITSLNNNTPPNNNTSKTPYNLIKLYTLILLNTYITLSLTIFTFQRQIMFNTKNHEKIDVYDRYKNIDIFYIDKKSDVSIVYCHGSICSGRVFKKLVYEMADMTCCNVISFNIRGMFNDRGMCIEKEIYEEIDIICEYIYNEFLSKSRLGLDNKNVDNLDDMNKNRLSLESVDNKNRLSLDNKDNKNRLGLKSVDNKDNKTINNNKDNKNINNKSNINNNKDNKNINNKSNINNNIDNNVDNNNINNKTIHNNTLINNKLIIFGQSLGCCIATYISKKLKTQKTIVENPFINYKSALKNTLIYKYLSYLVVDEWDNTKNFKNLNDVLFLVSTDDKVVSNSDSFYLSKIVKNGVIRLLKGNGHFDGAKNEIKNKNVPKQTPPKKSGVVESLLADIKRISTEIEKMKFKDDHTDDKVVSNSDSFYLSKIVKNGVIRLLKGNGHFDGAKNEMYYVYINKFISGIC